MATINQGPELDNMVERGAKNLVAASGDMIAARMFSTGPGLFGGLSSFFALDAMLTMTSTFTPQPQQQQAPGMNFRN